MAETNGEVLVVEDDADINELVGAYAQIAGYDYVAAHDGAEAMEQIRRHSPSLIVLDLMLPDLDGMEICRRVKSNHETKAIPVIIPTALDGENSRRDGRQCGAAAYLTKPFDPDRLMATIAQHAPKNGKH